MPTNQIVRVVVGERDRLGGGVKLGDYITINGHAGYVTGMELKQTWAYFNLDNQEKRRRLPIGTEVNVTRLVKSDEEKFDDRREDLIQSLAWDLQRHLNAHMDKAVNEIAIAWSETDHNTMTPVSVWMVEDLLAAQAERDNYLVVSSAWEAFSGGEKYREQGYSIIEAFHYTINRLREQLMDSDLSRGLSRSTSMMSNLFNDVRREQAVKFIREYRNVEQYSVLDTNEK